MFKVVFFFIQLNLDFDVYAYVIDFMFLPCLDDRLDFSSFFL